MARVKFNSAEAKATMPFGRYQGDRLEDIPTDYLRWVSTIAYEGWLKDAVEKELSSRQVEPVYAPTDIKEFALEIVGRGIRSCATKYHPDVGGDAEKMKTINEAGVWLRSIIID